MFFGRLLPSSAAAFPQSQKRSASTTGLSGPARASVLLRPACLLDVLRGLLSRGFESNGRPSSSPDSYRGASTIPRAGLSPAGGVHLSRRTGMKQLAATGVVAEAPQWCTRSCAAKVEASHGQYW